jgi:hypothetical protein
VLIARSLDGVRFTTVAELRRERFGADSLERPALVRFDGRWRLYVSCATPGSKHWWIGVLEAAKPDGLPHGRYRGCLRGDQQRLAVKDPVVARTGGRWRMWVCGHPLVDVGHEDRMFTHVAHSDDGLDWSLDWSLDETVLVARSGEWDARGARVTAVLDTSPLTVLYDGRATAEANHFERTGLAVATGHPSRLAAVSGPPRPRHTPTVRFATYRSCRSPEAALGCTTSWPGRTVPMTWSPSSCRDAAHENGSRRAVDRNAARAARALPPSQ